jgi:maltokinase
VTPEPSLDDAVARADPRLLLPELRAGEEAALDLPLRLVDALPLGTGWAALLTDRADRLVAAPLVRSAANVRRAAAGDGIAAALVARLAQGSVRGPGFELVAADPAAAPDPATVERAMGVDQTHDSVVVGEAAVVKWTVHATPPADEQPAVEALMHLTAVGFLEVPRPVGFLLADRPGGRVLLASVDRYLPQARDGWDWYVDDVVALAEGRATFTRAVEPATTLGGLVARMHAAFATPWPGTPQPVTTAHRADIERWHRAAVAALDAAVAVTAGDAGRRLRARCAAAQAALRELSVVEATPLTRVHGDLHVGQVLRWAAGYALTDFDGNPVLAPDDRARPASPARDVAAMLRSLDHVGRVVDRRTGQACHDVVRTWTLAARDGFLDAYRGELAARDRLDLLDERLLRPFEVEQACRELVYAARHLPRWTYVPDAALTDLLPSDGTDR